MNYVNIDGLTTAINKNNQYYEFLEEDVDGLTTVINELNNIYSGSSLDFLFKDITRQVKDINKLPMMVKNYSNVLVNVKSSYIAQESNIRMIYNRNTSNTNM
jgi:hypothetical protein